MKKFSYFCLLALMALMTSCTGKSVSGRAYEVLVVVDQQVWERPAGRALFNVLDTDVPGLPQSERSFRIMNAAPQHYDGTLKLLRNIIVVDIDPAKYTQPKFRYAKDLYASPQMVLTIQSPDEEQFAAFVTKYSQRIIDFFTHAEMNRQIALLEKKHNDFVSNKVKEMFGCDVWVPAELSSYKVGEDFFWAATNVATGDQNFVIYSYPYTDKRTFTKEFFMQKRDSVMAINIPGAREGMYMATDTLLSDVRPIMVQGAYCLEARGLWRIKGDFMGGPYVSHARVDEVNGRVIVAEIFVYSPDKLKRNLVRRMEASLYTLRLPGSNALSAEIPVEGVEQ